MSGEDIVVKDGEVCWCGVVGFFINDTGCAVGQPFIDFALPVIFNDSWADDDSGVSIGGFGGCERLHSFTAVVDDDTIGDEVSVWVFADDIVDIGWWCGFD